MEPMVNKTANEIVRVAQEVLAAEPRVAVAYLFGSVTRGTAGPMSDIDIGIVLSVGPSSDGVLGPLTDRLVLRLGTDRVDVIDLPSAPVPLRYRAVQGRVIVCADPRARERFEVDTVRRYLDFQPLRRRAFDLARAAILRAG